MNRLPVRVVQPRKLTTLKDIKNYKSLLKGNLYEKFDHTRKSLGSSR
jgi:hypothetical protein